MIQKTFGLNTKMLLKKIYILEIIIQEQKIYNSIGTHLYYIIRFVAKNIFQFPILNGLIQIYSREKMYKK